MMKFRASGQVGCGGPLAFVLMAKIRGGALKPPDAPQVFVVLVGELVAVPVAQPLLA